jgi:hypothetical protein
MFMFKFLHQNVAKRIKSISAIRFEKCLIVLELNRFLWKICF